MEYTITKEEKVKADKLSPFTTLAINAYKDIKRKENALERKREEHTKWFLNIPDEDIQHYIAITDEMDKK
jgi:hypothetical protein